MTSIRARVFRGLLGYHGRRADTDATLRQRRAALDDASRRMPMPRGIAVEPTTAGGRCAEWLCPDSASDDRAILYLHGGAYTMGSCATHRALAARVALGSGVSVLQLEYRLAPENPFPAALEDCLAAYRSLADSGVAPQQTVVAGDSAGGGLAMAMAITLRDERVPLPAAIVCLSPWVDLGLTGESLTTRARMDPICSVEESRYHARQYFGTHDPRAARVSPIYADLTGLPPLLIHVGDREILLSDATRLAARAREDGVDVELKVWDGLWHVWHLFAAYVPEGRRAIDDIGRFIRRHLDGPTPAEDRERHEARTQGGTS